MGKGNKRAWFGKRWTKAAIDWFDHLIFARKDDDMPFITVSSGFCISLTIGILAAAIIVVCSLFGDQKTLELYMITGAAGLSVLYTIWFLWQTLSYFRTVWSKIGRSLYVLVINIAACYLGIILGVWLTLAALAVLVLIVVLKLIGGDSGSSRRHTIVLTDGTELTETKGICGESYYQDGCGRDYDKVSDNTFRES